MPSLPRKAVLLAAGFATRLRPLSYAIPKPCVPLWNRPLLHHTLDRLAEWDVREVLINLYTHAHEIWSVATAWNGPIRLSFSFEPEGPLGTGGALRHASWFFDDCPFWLINSDIAFEADLTPLCRAWQERPTPLAVLGLVAGQGPQTVVLHNGQIASFRKGKPGRPDALTFSGIHLLDRRILPFLPPSGPASIVDAYEAAQSKGEIIRGCRLDNAFWADLGTVADLLAAHRAVAEAYNGGKPGARLFDVRQPARLRRLRRKGIRIQSWVAIAPDAHLAPGVAVRESIIASGAVVETGVELHHAIVAPLTRIQAGRRTGCLLPATAWPALAPFLQKAGWPPEAVTLCPFPPRGSDRTFVRLLSGSRTAILIEYGRERRENARYACHTQFLEGLGLRVPHLLFHEPRQRRLLMEDLGDRELGQAVRECSEAEQFRLYEPVLAMTACLHEKGRPAAEAAHLPLAPRFSPRLFGWERRYWARHFLQKRLGCSSAEIRPLMRELAAIADHLTHLPQVLLHRDLQSSNILLTSEGPAFIDYQGMRLGPAVYDLASLLFDPYVSLAESVQQRLLDRYRRQVSDPISDSDLWAAAVQRLAQALGAYARLGAWPATASFARHIPPALRLMRRAVARLGDATFPALAAFLDRTLHALPTDDPLGDRPTPVCSLSRVQRA
jgi:hypothetical protein